MLTRIEKIKNADDLIISDAGEILRQGGLVAFPTETVYGLGADALDEKASAKIYESKGRPSDNPLIVHIADWEALSKIAKSISENAKKLADAFWPGPLTMIFEKQDIVPLGTTGGLGTVAVRMPSHSVALELIRQGGGYVAAPSANSSGRPSPTKAEHVAEDLNGKIDMILDGGEVGIGIESTIVDMSGDIPMILRPGYITKEMLEQVVGRVDVDPAILGDRDTKERPKAPGMRYKHYAPRAELTLVQGETEKVIQSINELVAKAATEGKKAGIIASDETFSRYTGGMCKSIGTRQDEDTIARNLYGILRDFDASGVDLIYSEVFATPKLGQAIMNRLLKAAGHHIMYV